MGGDARRYFLVMCFLWVACQQQHCNGKLLPTLHVGDSFDALVNQSPAAYIASLGGSAARCSSRRDPAYLQACSLQNVCMDMSSDYMIGHNSYKLEVYPDRNKKKLSRQLQQRSLYFPRTQKYREGSQLYNNLDLPFVRLTEPQTTSSSSSSSSSRSSHSTPPPTSFYFIQKPIVLVDVLYGENYGHMYVDYVTSAYAGARELELHLGEFAFMPNRMYSHNASLKIETYLSSLLRVPLSHDLKKYVGNTVCFSQLLLPGYHGLFSNASSAVTRFSQSLRDIIYSNYPLPVSATSLSSSSSSSTSSLSPHILIAFKKQHLSVHGGRVLLNEADVRTAVTARFGSAVHMLDLGEASLAQQVTLLRSTAVFVCPLGGAAFSALLLPDGAVFVQIQGFNPVTNHSEPAARHDYDTFQKMKHIRILQHRVRRDEVVLESNAKARTKRMRYSESYYAKVLGNYQLDTATLVMSIEAALLLVDM
jgi:hypothetical protein